jgi:uncharacterized protein YndB with AHSA1/START domain
MNETLRIVDGRTELRMERRLAHPPAKVWRAITQPEHLGRWFPAQVRLELRPGAQVAYDDGSGYRPDGEVVEVDEPRLFAFTWGGELLRWEIRPDGAGSVLVLTHTVDDRYGAGSFAAGWEACVTALEQVLDGEPVSAPGPSAERLEEFNAAFGLTDGVRQGDELRFERQLSQPVEAVWELLTGGATPAVGSAPPAPAVAAGMPAGPVTAVEAPNLLAYGDGVRIELRPGTGHGARLVLVAPARPETAPAAWKDHLDRFAATVADGSGHRAAAAQAETSSPRR